MRRLRHVLIALALAAGTVVLAQTPLTPIMQLQGRTDANGALYVTAAVASGTQTPLTPIGQLQGRTDANGSLYTTVSGGTVTPDKICLDATNQDACLQRNGAGVLQLGNAATSTGFNRLQFGGSTASFASWKGNGTQLDARLADDSNYANVAASVFIYAGRIASAAGTLISATAPSAPASCGTSPVVTANNGTAAFVITGGTGGAATGCTVTMPTAPTGWNCHITNRTQTAANRADRDTRQTASTTTSVTWQYVVVSTGAATAFTASDAFHGICFAY